MNKANAEAAYWMGHIAFAQGIKCAPAMDRMFMSHIAGRPIGDPRTAKEMKAWAKGWALANLTANRC